MKRHVAVLAVLPALALGAAACGDDEETAGTGGAAMQEQAAEAPAQPRGEDVVTLAQGNRDLSTLVDAVTAAELAETLQGKGPFTVFAPTNAAFQEVGQAQLQELLEPANKEQLSGLLTYHVVPGELMASDLEDGRQLKTVNGETLTVRVRDGEVRVGDATVVTPDVDAANGVVHVIDSVLAPPSA